MYMTNRDGRFGRTEWYAIGMQPLADGMPNATHAADIEVQVGIVEVYRSSFEDIYLFEHS